jgi:predicted RNA-binding protein with PUA-like domain
MNYFLLKSEPDVYGIDHLQRDGQTRWDGIRNFQARNNLKAMKAGDLCLFYHTGDEKQVVGLAEVIKAPYPEPTKDKGDWVAVDIAFKKQFAKAVTLAQIKANPNLKDMRLIRQSRLSVQLVEKNEYEEIVKYAK